MSVVVGYRAGNIGLSGLNLAAGAARTLKTSLTVATIVPKPWLSLGRGEAEYEQWAADLVQKSVREAERALFALGEGLEINYRHRAHRSVSGGLIEVVEEVGGEILVLGSLPSGGRAQVVVGTTADWLLHSSPVPVAISPPEYRSHPGGLTRLTCAYSATPQSADVVRRCVEYSERFHVPLRVVTFAVRGKTMYPPEVGLDAEDVVLEAWASQARDILDGLKSDGIVGDDVTLQVVTGHNWAEALEGTEWIDGEILVIGTSPRGDIRRVFLGARSGKIIRHSPVPVLVLPG
ncbi:MULTISPECIES: universal stress protein [Mycobacterium]|uniref:Universal stress protein n=1 Tax=Mycobacterium kiyosense TaxID=2871094 RepID=A0A9P3Q9M0_9MYCO|nr:MULTISPECIES: universal stress protein [Mycobacterium]BDB41745.1 universal stress protein [Mycobacterium kiyosense]BDE14963.1 universal stress protein [Mycobacterium sp. 20KCMC460]GLB86595.1 universal stress protein [Mycobacterium kiyosense]GLB87776.1 universal stress protein [Mycobacterium kiyosense]GLB99168.1 universal stress protein [Mycobacterium kiyosense]